MTDAHVAGTIAALVWDEYSPGCFFGKTEFGDYAIAPSASAFHIGEIRISGLDGEFTYAADIPSAKAAAQADYEARIRSSILPAQGRDEPVAWTGSGSMAQLRSGRGGFMWPEKDDPHPIPLYAHPAPAVSLPEDVAGLCMALRSGEQADMDGCRVKVSRQACEEGADTIEAQAAEVARLTGALSDTIKKWSKSQDAQIDALDRLEQAEAEVARLKAALSAALDVLDAHPEQPAPDAVAEAAKLILADDIALSRMAEAIHDGPLGADDHWFSAALPQGAWCLDVARAGLLALASQKETQG